jgi:hypothetical protein
MSMRILPVVGSALALSVGAGTASADESSCPPGTSESCAPRLSRSATYAERSKSSFSNRAPSTRSS